MSLDVVVHICNRSTGRQRWENGKFQASLGYIETLSQKNSNGLKQSIEVDEFWKLCRGGEHDMARQRVHIPQISLPLRPSWRSTLLVSSNPDYSPEVIAFNRSFHK